MPEWSAERTLIIAHRGVSGDEAENTMPALRASLTRGMRAIEIDVRQTADRVMVLCHDDEVAGLTVADTEYAVLLSKAPEICPLKDVLAEMPASCLLHVDLKAMGIEADVLNELRAARGYEDYIVSSLEDEAIARVKAIDPYVRAGLSLGRDKPARLLRTRLSELNPTRRLCACGADFVVPHWRLLRFGFLGRMARLGYPVYVWTVNSPRVMRRMLRRPEVAGLITDVPLVAIDVQNAMVERRVPVL